MIDRSSGFTIEMLRAPDLRLNDVRSRVLKGVGALSHRVEANERSAFFYADAGDFQLRFDDMPSAAIRIRQGSGVGIEDGRAHLWTAIETSEITPFTLFTSNIPRRIGVLKGLADGLIVVPPDAHPFSDMIHHTAKMHMVLTENDQADPDDTVARRCAEIVLIQFISYARSRITREPEAPVGLAHDEHLLRAWSAYFADPQRRWTVKALAEAAHLSRTTFSERFRAMYGEPPLHALTTIRLSQAEEMLRHGKVPLIEIAFSVGYNSEAAFVRAFHRLYGMPPGRFRMQNTQDTKSDPVASGADHPVLGPKRSVGHIRPPADTHRISRTGAHPT